MSPNIETDGHLGKSTFGEAIVARRAAIGEAAYLSPFWLTIQKAKVGIFSLELLALGSLGVVPSLAAIAADFPEASAMEVQMLTAVPGFVSLISSLLFPKLASSTSRKAISIASVLLILVGGIVPFFVHPSLMFLIVCGGVLGLGVGFVPNCTSTLISELISPEKRQAVMAQNTVFMSLGSMFLLMVGGMLGAMGWEYNYLVYLICLPILLIVIACIPAGAGSSEANGAQPGSAPKGHLGSSALTIAVITCVFMLINQVVNNNASMLIAAKELGDSSVSGIVTSMSTISGILTGLVLGKVIGKFQKVSLAVSFALMGVSMVAYSFASSVPLLIACSFVCGIAAPIIMSQSPFIISISSKPQDIPTGMAAWSFGNGLGGSISPIIMGWLAAALMSGSAADSFLLGGILALVACAVLLVTGVQGKIMDAAFAKMAGAQGHSDAQPATKPQVATKEV